MAILSYVTVQDGEGKVIQNKVAIIVSFTGEDVSPNTKQ